MNSQTERTWAEVHPENILHNMKRIRDSLPAGTKFLGVVKANAYGHGALTVAKALEANGADYLAVACLAEAVELREAGVAMPILILGATPPEDVPQLLQYVWLIRKPPFPRCCYIHHTWGKGALQCFRDKLFLSGINDQASRFSMAFW